MQTIRFFLEKEESDVLMTLIKAFFFRKEFFAMNIYTKEGITIVITEHRLDALVSVKFKDTVKKLVEDGSQKILIDMGETVFIDSAGCGALVASLRALSKNKGDMKIARPSSQVQTLFELTRLHKVFEIFEDVESASKSFS
ncbi:MAG: STAS domain-containing protein [Desulfomonile sp.]